MDRKTRSDKKINVNPNLPRDSHDKLQRLAISCNMSKTKLAETIITLMVNNTDFINHIQDKHNKEHFYRITPIVINGELQY